MVGRLSDALGPPLEARHRMLTGAGFAARYAARDWDEDEMAPVRGAVARMLERHRPFPGLAVDQLWTILRMHPDARAIFAPLGEGGSMLEMMLSHVLPELVENWPDVAHHAAQRLRTESAGQGGVPELDGVGEVLGQVPRPEGEPMGPVKPAIYRMGSHRHSLFAIIAQFGTPEDLALDDMKVEAYFPRERGDPRGAGSGGGDKLQ